MYPTFIGAGIIAAGLWILVRGSVPAMLAMLMCCTVMAGGAALQLPALGGSSLPPFEFALVFLIARLAFGEARYDIVRMAVALNLCFVVYVAYGITMAYMGPHLFHDTMLVVPMRPTEIMDRLGLPPVPLEPTSQNITSSVYITGTLLLAVCASAAMLHRDGPSVFLRTAVAISWLQVFLGVSGALLNHTPWTDFLDLFRNGNYAQLDQSVGGFTRIKGIATEPSGYASQNFAWFVFLFECWLRGVRPRMTGPVAAALALTLVFSTSSTAYLGLGVYFAALAGRIVLIPGTTTASRKMAVVAAGFAGVLAVVAVFAVLPSVANSFTDVVLSMTVNKGSSGSAIQRAQIARQGIDAFRISHGLGIGPGSFRSSSFATAVLGTTGALGTLAFGTYLLQVFRPLRPSTYVPFDDQELSLGVAAAWAAFVMMIPASLTSPSGDPGPEFAVLAGTAIAIRWKAMRLAEQHAPPAVPMRDTTLPRRISTRDQGAQA